MPYAVTPGVRNTRPSDDLMEVTPPDVPDMPGLPVWLGEHQPVRPPHLVMAAVTTGIFRALQEAV